jgi:hypothetical protein
MTLTLTIAVICIVAVVVSVLWVTRPTKKKVDKQGKRWTDYGEKI